VEFLIWGLPRSRTAWLSHLLSGDGWYCGHDESAGLRSISDLKKRLSIPRSGSAETGGMEHWRLLLKWAPGLKLVLIRRSVSECYASCIRAKLASPGLLLALRRMDSKLNQIANRWPSERLLVVDYEDIDSKAEEILDFCEDRRLSKIDLAALCSTKIVCDTEYQLRYCTAFKDDISFLMGSMGRAGQAELHLGRPHKLPLGMELRQIHSKDEFLNLARPMLAEHQLAVGEPADGWQYKNLELMDWLAKNNQLIAVAALSNGRMFGYIFAEISQSREHHKPIGIATAFYASPDAPGIGLRLARDVTKRLVALGCHEIFYRAGPRGSGPRVAAIWKRLGALPDGELYRLTVNE
jgi:hypothetical protein